MVAMPTSRCPPGLRSTRVEPMLATQDREPHLPEGIFIFGFALNLARNPMGEQVTFWCPLNGRRAPKPLTHTGGT